MTHTLLRIDASARHDGSVTRSLTDRIVEKFTAESGTRVITRDLTDAIPQVSEAWIGANFTPADARDDAQKAQLALSDTLVSEIQAADTVVIGVPLYNFSIPAALKAWIDHVARAGVTFKYTENGPEGLLHGKRAILVVATGGVPIGSAGDFATGYMRHVLGFIGITEVDVVAASQTAVDMDAAMEAANKAVASLAA